MDAADNPNSENQLEIDRLLAKWEEIEKWEAGKDRDEIARKASWLAVLAENLEKLGVTSIKGSAIRDIISQQNATIRSAFDNRIW